MSIILTNIHYVTCIQLKNLELYKNTKLHYNKWTYFNQLISTFIRLIKMLFHNRFDPNFFVAL